MAELHGWGAYGELSHKPMSEERVAAIRHYFAEAHPDWHIMEDRNIVRLIFTASDKNHEYVIRNVLDVDIRIGETPFDLERAILSQQVAYLTRLVNDMLDVGTFPQP